MLTVNGVDYFERFLVYEGEHIPSPRIVVADAENSDLIRRKIDITVAKHLTNCVISVMLDGYMYQVGTSACGVSMMLWHNEEYISQYPEIMEYYQPRIDHLIAHDKIPHWQRALGRYIYTPLENPYEVQKWMLDESLSIIMKYPEEVELQRTIQALQLINEERDRTRLAELINGGWKTDDRILKILNVE